MLIYTGGDSAEKVKRIPNWTPDKYIEVLPGAVTMWKGILNFGGDRFDGKKN